MNDHRPFDRRACCLVLVILIAGVANAGCGTDDEDSASASGSDVASADAGEGGSDAVASTDAAAASDGTSADTSAVDIGDEDVGSAAPMPPPGWLGGDRPASVVVPSDYDPRGNYPLVILLHGLSASADLQDLYFGLSRRVDEYDFVLLLPNGTMNSDGNRFWNATRACCDFERTGVDDIGYLLGLIAESYDSLAVDRARIYLIGHSNGGFMSYAFACEHGERIAGFASLAGGTHARSESCRSPVPTTVLQIHGTDDRRVDYDGTEFYPSAVDAVDAVERWAGRASCATEQSLDPVDLDTSVDGAETARTLWTDCEDGVETALWTIESGGHVPTVAPDFTDRILEFLFAHAR